MADITPSIRLIEQLKAGQRGQRIKIDGKTMYRVGNTNYHVEEYEESIKLVNRVKSTSKTSAMIPAPEPVIMTPEEFATFNRLAIPDLLYKLYHMAKISEDPKVVLAVVKEFGDRAYGKAVQSLEVNLGPDVRGAWAQLENFDRPVITQETVETVIQEVENVSVGE